MDEDDDAIVGEVKGGTTDVDDDKDEENKEGAPEDLAITLICLKFLSYLLNKDPKIPKIIFGLNHFCFSADNGKKKKCKLRKPHNTSKRSSLQKQSRRRMPWKLTGKTLPNVCLSNSSFLFCYMSYN